MKEVTVSFSAYTYKLADVPAPRIRTAKEWRRHQVAMKRLRERIDNHLMRAMFGDQYGCNRPVESYPPKPTRRRSWLEIATIS